MEQFEMRVLSTEEATVATGCGAGAAADISAAGGVGVTKEGGYMNGSRKICFVKKELMQRQIPWKTVVPPLWRLFWRYDLAIAPPMFVGFFGNFVISWLGFWGLSLLCAYILPWGHQDPVVWTVLSWGLAAALFGILDGSRVQQEASRLGVPRWKDFR